jgi:uncharacterized protein (DUF2147 family)
MRTRSFLTALLLALPVAVCTLANPAAELSSAVGLWNPVDAHGQPLGLIRIYESNGLFFGRIEPTEPVDSSPDRCTRCTDERKDQPLPGLVLIRNMRFHDGEYSGGDILDPHTGKIYGCQFKLADGGRQLIMRGFLGIPLLGQSQTWQRAR